LVQKFVLITGLYHFDTLLSQLTDCGENVDFLLLLHALDDNIERDECSGATNASTGEKGT
jgi:hypothetical protein